MKPVVLTDEQVDAYYREEDERRARAAALVAPAVSPDGMGQADRIARRRGLPAQVVADNLPDFQEQDAHDAVVGAAAAHPAVASWLQDPANVALAKDDTEHLSQLGRMWEITKASAPQTLGGIQQMVGETIDQVWGAVRDRIASVAQAAGPSPILFTGAQAGNIAGVGEKVAESGAEQVDYGLQAQRAAEQGVRAPEDLADFVRNPGGNTSRYLLDQVAGSVFPMGVSMLGGVAAGPVAGSGLMGATTAGQSFGQYRAEGVPYEKAAPAALVQGVEEAAFEGLPMTEALRPGVTFAHRLLHTAASEGWTEFLTQLAQDKSENAMLDRPQLSPMAALTNAVTALATGTTMGVGMAGAGHLSSGSIEAGVDKVRQRARSNAQATFLQQQVDAALASKVRARSPDRYEDLMARVAPAAKVFIPVETLNQLYQSPVNAQAAITDLTGDPAAYLEADATGGEVGIPLAKYLTHLSEQHEALKGQVRLESGQEVRGPQAMPTAEEIKADLEAALAETSDVDVEAARQGAAFQDVYGQLHAARVEPGVAEKQAALVQQVFDTWASRFGMDPAALYQQFKFRINQPQTDPGPRRRGIDMSLDPYIDQVLAERDAPALNPPRGDSLIDAVIGAGGINPESVGAGDLRAIQRPGLLNRSGLTVERMGETLADDGLGDLFTTRDEFGRPDYRELLEMLRDEHTGARAFTFPRNERQAARLAEQQRMKDDVKAALQAIGTRGVDTSKLSREELRPLVMEELDRQQQLQQSQPVSAQPLVSALRASVEEGKGAPKKGDAKAWKQWLDGAQRRGEFRQAERDWLGVDRWLDEIASSTDPAVQQVYPNGQVLRAQVQEFVRAQELQVEEVLKGPPADPASAAGSVAPQAPYSNMVLPGGANYRVLLLKLPSDPSDVPGRSVQREGQNDFTGGHFEANTVAHVRFDERTGANGERVLFLNEIQSDWHQQGRKKGYRTTDATGWRADLLGNTGDDYQVYNAQGEPVRYIHARSEEEAIRETLAADNSNRVPDAPFKTTWPELALKRMVRWAAENGFDRVAWPTAEQVPLVEQWGVSTSQIRADPHLSQRFGAIIDRYAVDLPRIAKALGKKYGAAVVPVTMETGGRSEEIQPPPALEPADTSEPALDGYQSFTDGPPLVGSADLQIDGVLRRSVTIVVDAEGVHLSWWSNGPNTLLAHWGDVILESDAPTTQREAEEAFGFAWRAAPEGNDTLGGGIQSLWEPITFERPDEADGGYADVKAPQATTTTNPSLEINDKLRDAALAGLPLFQGGARGGITGGGGRSVIGDRGADGSREFNISLFAGMDFSTFLHESGHAFLEIFGDLAERADAPESVKADWKRTLAYLGVEDRSAIGREQHETWARSFEAYLREGRAPSRTLRRMFAAFRTWLMGVYRSALNLNVALTDDVRGVFDRMVATDDEIARARSDLGLDPLIPAGETVGMTPEQALAYHEAVAAALSDAEGALAGEVLREQQRAERAFLGAERRKVRAEVEASTRLQRPYRALRWLRRGLLPDGTPAPQAVKLSRQALIDAGYLPAFIRLRLSGTYSKAGGLGLDEAAELLGYGSGQEMVEDLVNAPLFADVVKADTDRIMAERYPDPLVDGSLADRALIAVHREKQAEAMLLGVQALERHVDGRVRSQAHVIAEAARRMIAGKRARDVHPNSYLMAERKAGREALAAAAKQDWTAAASAGRRQLLAHALYAEARRSQDEVAKAQRALRRLTTTKARAKLGKAGGTYLEVIDGILERFDLKPVSGPQSQRRASLAAWVTAQQEAGYEVNIPEDVLDEAFRMPFQDLTVQQVRDVRDAVKHVKALADLKGKLLLAAEGRTFDEVRDSLVDSIAGNHDVVAEAMDLAPKWTHRFGDWLARADALLTKAEFIFTWLDGERANGPVWRALFQPFVDAEFDEVQRNAAISQKLKAIFDGYDRARMSTQRIYVAEAVTKRFAGNFTRASLLAVGLNMGNDYNREAMMEGAGWTPAQLQAVAARLTSKDWDTIEAIWALYEDVRVDAFALQKAMTGLEPERVTPTPFLVAPADGPARTVTGGYHPVRFDSEFSYRAYQRDMKVSVQDQYGGGFSRAMTRQGHLKERTGTGGQPIKLSLSVVTEHLANAVHDITHRRAVFDVQRLLDDDQVRGAIEGSAGRQVYRVLKPWLTRIAAGSRSEAHAIEGLLHRARVGATVVSMGLKISTAIVQPLGLLQTVEVIGPRAVGIGLKEWGRSPVGAVKFAMARSKLLGHRLQSYDRDVRDSLNRVTSGGLRDDIQRSFFILTGLADMSVVVPSWLGAYHTALAGDVRGVEAGREDDAIAYADGVVRQSQSSGSEKDLAAVQRGSEAFRLFTMFYSYFSVLYSLGRRAIKRTKSARDVPRLVASAFLLWFVPAVLSEIVAGRGPDDDDWAEWMKTHGAWQLASYPVQTVPVVRDVMNGLEHYRYSPSPAFDAFASAVGTVKVGWKAGKIGIGRVTGDEADEEITRADIKNALMTAGYWGHLPTRQLWITSSYLYDLATGEEQPESAADVFNGLAFARPGK